MEFLSYPKMNILNLFRPKWQHSDAATRQNAVKTIKDTLLLTRIAAEDHSQEVRLAAIHQIDDLSALAQIGRGSFSEELRLAAIHRIDNLNVLLGLLEEIEKELIAEGYKEKQKNVFVRAIIDQINDEPTLAKLADSYESAMRKLPDHYQELFARFAKERTDLVAADRLTRQDLIEDVVRTGKSTLVRCNLVVRIVDDIKLGELAESHENAEVRAAAKHAWEIRAGSLPTTTTNAIKAPDDPDLDENAVEENAALNAYMFFKKGLVEIEIGVCRPIRIWLSDFPDNTTKKAFLVALIAHHNLNYHAYWHKQAKETVKNGGYSIRRSWRREFKYEVELKQITEVVGATLPRTQ